MAKSMILTVLAVTVVAAATVANGQTNTDQQLVADLVKRGNTILTNAKTQLKTLQSKNSYFVQPVQDEINRLEKFIAETEKVAKDTKMTTAQLGLVEARLLRYENDLLTILLIEQEASKDASFGALIAMVDKLLQRAYTDLGQLVVSGGAQHRLIAPIQAEIIALKNTEDELKRLQASSITAAKTLETVEQVILHEKNLNNLLFQAEHDDIFNPKF